MGRKGEKKGASYGVPSPLIAVSVVEPSLVNHNRWYYTLMCGHTGVKNGTPPGKKVRCAQCKWDALDDQKVYYAGCYTCEQKRKGGPPPIDPQRLSFRLLSRREARADVKEHKTQYPTHEVNVVRSINNPESEA